MRKSIMGLGVLAGLVAGAATAQDCTVTAGSVVSLADPAGPCVQAEHLPAELAASDALTTSPRLELAQAEAALADRDERLGGLDAQLTAVEQDQARQDRKLADLRTDVEGHTARIILLEAILADRVVELDDLNATILNLTTELSNSIAAMAAELADREAHLTTEQLARAALATELETTDGDLAETRQALEDRQATLSGAPAQRARLDGAEADMAELRLENESLREQFTELATLQAQFDSLTRDLARSEAREQAAEAEAARLSEQLAALNLLNARLDVQLSALEEDRLDDERQEEIIVDEDLVEARAEIAEMQQERDQYRQSLVTVETAVSIAEDNENEAAIARAAAEAQLQQFQDALAQAQEALRVADQVARSRNVEVGRLQGQAELLTARIAELNALLTASEQRVSEQDAELGIDTGRVNSAAIRQLERLAQYRSEFFELMSDALGDREGIGIVGDRFLFSSEVLFDSASAEIGGADGKGEQELARLAATVLTIIDALPEGIDWILRIDGHTDDRPIQTEEFPSNWELSLARANAVVQFLITQGIPEQRLAAAGFAEFQPIDPGSLARNRRIEIRIDQRGSEE